ncbi:hypothetical protein G5I_06034 [Acromyrmex echinatior]|uniref:Uncharacterized protein n=1 Tax=Acromyrmex echinatior TaxID=103372 RepID=F4WJZ8_ACREC|nr:hypothetical protein G5I_06034 [Acromyrmex echinatior]
MMHQLLRQIRFAVIFSAMERIHTFNISRAQQKTDDPYSMPKCLITMAVIGAEESNDNKALVKGHEKQKWLADIFDNLRPWMLITKI